MFKFVEQLTGDSEKLRRGIAGARELSLARQQDDSSYYYVLQELSNVIAGKDTVMTDGESPSTIPPSSNPVKVLEPGKVTKEADRLMWEASSSLADSRPPSSLCIYDRSGSTSRTWTV